MSKILGAVEIGTHKAKAMVGVLSPTGDLKVVAAASVKNEGVRKGEIVDYRKTASAVHAAIDEADARHVDEGAAAGGAAVGPRAQHGDAGGESVERVV